MKNFNMNFSSLIYVELPPQIKKPKAGVLYVKHGDVP